jgi:D-alanine-D-alanine ligase
MQFKDIKNVIILAGGPSSEAKISRVTAKGVAGALKELKLKHQIWELEGDWLARLAKQPKSTFVFIALHGCPGEDGTVQGALDLLGLPYQGSGVLGNALAMDKARAREAMAAHGVPVAAALHGEALKDKTKVAAFLKKHRKLVAKPNAAGSSVGVAIFKSMAEWPKAYKTAADHGEVLVEAFIPGRELTVGVLGTKALPVVEIIPNKGEFYDIESKYAAGGSDHIVPAKLPKRITAALQQGAVKAAKAVGAKGACRVDFRYDDANNTTIALEVNTLPGLTPTSLLPDAARCVGTSYPALVRWMIEDGLKR